MTAMVARLDAQLQATRSQLADGKVEIERLSRLLQENAFARRDSEDGHAVVAGMAMSAARLEDKADPSVATGAATTGTTKANETGREGTAGNAQEGRATTITAAADQIHDASEGTHMAPAPKRLAASHAGEAKPKRRRGSTLQYIGTGVAGFAKDGRDSAEAAKGEEEGVRLPAPRIHPVFDKFEQAAKRMLPSTIARVVDTAREAGVATDKIVACEKMIMTAAAAATAVEAAETRDAGEDGDGDGGDGEFDVNAGERKVEERRTGAAAATGAAEDEARMELEALVETRTGARRILTKTPLDLMLAAMEVNAYEQS